jgi:hypothetical protein
MRSNCFLIATLCAAALPMGACSKSSVSPPTPTASTHTADSAVLPASGKDAAVPAADTVFTSAESVRPEPATERSNAAMTPAQEFAAMPLPGQTNDHSAPLSTGKPASGP